MNLAVCREPQSAADALRKLHVKRDRIRALFLSCEVLGLVRFGRSLEAATSLRQDIDAIHIRLGPPCWLRALGKSVPGMSGWDCHVLRYGFLWSRIMQGWFAGPISMGCFDLVHVMNQHHAMALLRKGWPDEVATVVAIDATAEAEMRDFGYGPLDRRLVARRERKLFNAVDAVSCMSRWAADSVRNDYGVAPQRVLECRLGVDAASIPRRKLRALDSGSPPRILFVGNDWARKGGDRLWRWYCDRWQSRAELHVVGRGCPTRVAGPRVTRYGSVDHGRLLNEIMPRMDLCVLPTREDTLVFALLEAQAAGVPVVSSRLAGIQSDVVVDGVTGILCKSEDDDAFIQAVERLLGDQALCEQMGHAARLRTVERWSAEQEGNRYLDSLIQLTASRRRDRGAGQA